MIAWDAVENAVRTWVLAASGLAANRVYFADQDVPAGEAAPRVTIRIGGPVHLGLDAIEQSFDPGQPAGQEILQTARGFRTITVDLQSFAPTMVGAGDTALAVMAKIQAALSLPSVRYTLNTAGLGVLQEGNIQRIPQVRQAINEDRATLSVRFCVTQSISERLGYIDSVEVRSGRGPSLWISGWEDRAKMLALERVANLALPAFPRRIDGARGGVTQFTRAGANVVSGIVRDYGLLVDRNTDRLVHALIGAEHTIGAWLRIDPLVVLAGVSVPSYRVFIVAGADGSLTAQQATYGFSFSPVTMELFLLTQTPGVSGTSINVNSSKLGVALVQDAWTHVVATVRRNLLDVEPNEWGATVDWYVNGVFVNSDVGTGGTGATGPRIPRPSLYPPPRIVTTYGGAYSNTVRTFTNGFDGAVDDLFIVPRVLSAGEVATVYASGPFGLRV